MEDIYGDLENYNEVNLVEELKSENQDLKMKLAEYTSAVAKLQKDLDKLSNEHKKLELNYSSLLKTAKAEIERKTQMITQLNVEKDKLVIQSIQNTGRNILKSGPHYGRTFGKVKDNRESYSDTSKENKNIQNKEIGRESEIKRKEANVLTIDSTSSISTTKTMSTKSVHDAKSRTTVKENISKDLPYTKSKSQLDFDCKPKSDNVMSQRKIMPVSSNISDKFSSDEDGNIDEILKDIRIKDKEHRELDKLHTEELDKLHFKDRYSNRKRKIEELSQYHGPSRYKRKKYDRYRDKTKDYIHERHHRYSPEWNRHRTSRIMKENYEYSSRSERRHRVLESPPKDRYNRSKSRDHRYAERRDSRDFENYIHITKHRKSGTEEPNIKKNKTESYPTEVEHGRKTSNNRDGNMYLRHEMGNITTCQSPDYDHHSDDSSHHFIKEIMHTATVKLDDPRITSKKYVLHKENEKDKVCITRTAFGDGDIKPVDKSVWGIEKVDLPEPLKNKTPLYSNIDKENFHDDEPVLNLSLESEDMISFGDDLSPMSDISKTNLSNSDEERSNKLKTKMDTLTQNKESRLSEDYESMQVQKLDKKLLIKYKKPNYDHVSATSNKSKTNSSYEEEKANSFKTNLDTVTKNQECKFSKDYESVQVQKSNKKMLIKYKISHDDHLSPMSDVPKLSSSNKEEKKANSSKTNLDTPTQKLYSNINNYESVKDQTIDKKLATKYKIPKIKKNEEQELDPKNKKKETKSENNETKMDKKYVETITKNSSSSSSKNVIIKHNETLVDENLDDEKNKTDITVEKTLVQDIHLKKNLPFKNCVEGDLELSDEASDNEYRNILETNEDRVIPGHDLQVQCGNNTIKNPETRQNMDGNSEIKTITKIENSLNTTETNEQTKEISSKRKSTKDSTKENKKHKSKKIVTNALDVDLLETKKNNNKKSKESKTNKKKFTELFGDTSSLITPDDLGIPGTPLEKCVIYENTQDAVDINLDHIKKGQENAVKINLMQDKFEQDDGYKDQPESSNNKVIATAIDNQAESGNSNLDLKEIIDNDSNLIKTDTVMVPLSLPSVLPSSTEINEKLHIEKNTSNLYSNLESGIVPDNCVNTVIISKGVQATSAMKSIEDRETQPGLFIPKNMELKDVPKLNYTPECLKAVATSTPYKPQIPLPQTPFLTVLPEISSSSQSENGTKDNVESDLSQDSNKCESKGASDKPDVTIFVKKRRKYKKPTWAGNNSIKKAE